MNDPEGLLHAYALDGKGGGTARTWDSLDEPIAEGGFLWLHLDRTDQRATTWLIERGGLDPVVSDALLAEETRPRSTRLDHGILINLRGVNLNPGASPEDMVSVRIWIEAGRIVTVRSRRLMAVEDVRASIDQHKGPRTPMGLLVRLADTLAQRMEPVIGAIEDELDSLEEAGEDENRARTRARIAALRRRASQLRRFIGPQRDALNHLIAEDLRWITNQNRQHLRETANDITRFVEALNAAWERAAVINDEQTTHMAEATNQRLYLLSVVTTIFLPLSFITGLLGINVGGIPAAENAYGFAAVIGLLIALTGFEVWLLRRLRWF